MPIRTNRLQWKYDCTITTGLPTTIRNPVFRARCLLALKSIGLKYVFKFSKSQAHYKTYNFAGTKKLK